MSTPLRLYNTLTPVKDEFAPLDPRAVRMYVCGPTVYDFAHIGNARPVIVFDVLFRLLRRLYGADHVVYARNVTDVDDKINARAARDFPGLPLNEAIARVTEATERQFHDDVAALGCLPPTHEPRATAHIDGDEGADRAPGGARRRLCRRGARAVLAERDGPLPGAPRYGALARRSLDEMLAGARVDVAPYKRDPMDFVLWKPSKPNEPGWPSPCGIAHARADPAGTSSARRCRWPKLLAPFGGGLACDDPRKNVFDIHGGGVDLVFPHHENEIAQSCCAFGAPRMANVWMHNGFLQVEGEKMSKSLGNFITINDLLRSDAFGGRAWSGRGAAARDAAHPLPPADRLDGQGARRGREHARPLVRRDRRRRAGREVATGVEEALSDDLNTPAALGELHRLAIPRRRSGTRADPEGERQSAWPAPANAPSATARRRSASIDTARIELARRARGRPRRQELGGIRPPARRARRARRVLKGTKDGTTWEVKR